MQTKSCAMTDKIGCFNGGWLFQRFKIFNILGQALFVNKENGAPITLKLIWYAENMLARHALVTFHPGEGAEIEGQSSSPD